MKAVLCPVCNGVGMVSAGFYNRGGDCLYWVSSGLSPEICRSCNGKGWVEIAEEKPIDLVEELTGQKQEDWSKCPTCGQDRNEPPLTGCPKGSHYGTYCEV